jgi:hypothetical protein
MSDLSEETVHTILFLSVADVLKKYMGIVKANSEARTARKFVAAMERNQST